MSEMSLREAIRTIPWRQSGWRWLWLTVLLIVADQASKAWIEANYLLGEFTPVFFWLDITRLHNPGAAFSLLADAVGWQRWFFTGLALVVSVLLLVWLRSLDARRDRTLVLALALVLSGAIGNVIDRLEHGFVIDFIHLHWQQAYFPAFNLADSSITVGAVLLIYDSFLDWIRNR